MICIALSDCKTDMEVVKDVLKSTLKVIFEKLPIVSWHLIDVVKSHVFTVSQQLSRKYLPMIYYWLCKKRHWS
jgi:hypothetical protein